MREYLINLLGGVTQQQAEHLINVTAQQTAQQFVNEVPVVKGFYQYKDK